MAAPDWRHAKAAPLAASVADAGGFRLVRGWHRRADRAAAGGAIGQSRALGPVALSSRRDLGDLVLERVVIEYLTRSRFCKELQIVNGLVPGMVTRALEGEDVGTIIFQE